MSLATHIRVGALLAQMQNTGAGAYVLHRGEGTAGALIVKQAHLDGTATLFARQYAWDGELVWAAIFTAAPESEIDDHWRKRVEGDPDIWVIEIERRGAPLDLDALGL